MYCEYYQVRSGFPALIKTLFNSGNIVYDELRDYANERNTIDISPIMIKFIEPNINQIPHKYVHSKNYLKEYARQFLSKNNMGFEYTYGERLLAYPNGNIDQIALNVVCRLRANILSRRATATTIVHDLDLGRSDVPCLQVIDFKFDMNSNKLNMIAYFRSQDIMALPANVYGLSALLQAVSKALIVDSGSITLVDGSLHAYERSFEYLASLVYGKKDATSVIKSITRKVKQNKYNMENMA